MKKQFSVLTVDDMPDQLKRMKKFLLEDFPDSDVLFGKEQPRILCAKDGEEALKMVRQNPDINVILSDLVMPPTSTGGFWLAKKVFFEFKDRPMFFFLISDKQQLYTMTERKDWKDLEKELERRTGWDQILLYSAKPWSELKGDIVAQFFKYLRRGLVRVVREFDEKRFYFKSEKMRDIEELAKKYAKTDYPVLITGETGVGKGVFAQLIHKNSSRGNEKMVHVNVAAVSETLFESEMFGHKQGAFTGATEKRMGRFEFAKKNTIFLDEIGELPMHTQAKLLKVIEKQYIERVGDNKEIEINCRIIAATNKDLPEAIEKGTFRRDFFSRLKTLSLEIPPLRKRKEDIEGLVTAIYYREVSGKSLSEDYKEDNTIPDLEDIINAIANLKQYSWPENVRELEQFVQLSLTLRDADLALEAFRSKPVNTAFSINLSFDPFDPDIEFKDKKRRIERLIIQEALKRTEGRQVKAAKLLNIKESTLTERIKSFKKVH